VKSERPCVLVTGVGGRSVGHQVLHALSLTGNRYKIICTDADSFSFGLYLTPHRYLVPLANDPDYLDAILAIIERENVDVILPGTEAEVMRLVQCRGQLHDVGCKLIASPESAVALCNDKAELYRWLAREKIGVPTSVGVDDWPALVEKAGFPIVAKPATGSGGSRSVELLATAAEVEDYISRFPGSKENIVFQEYVGNAESEYTVGVLIGRRGDIVDSIVMRRHLVGLSLGHSRKINGVRYALSTGYSQGIIVRDPGIQGFCEDLALRLGLQGPANIQLRVHNGEIKVFEVHPRFSGTTSIRAQAGFNEPDLMIQNHLLDADPGRQSYRTNVAAIRAFQSILVSTEEMESLPHYPYATS